MVLITTFDFHLIYDGVSKRRTFGNSATCYTCAVWFLLNDTTLEYSLSSWGRGFIMRTPPIRLIQPVSCESVSTSTAPPISVFFTRLKVWSSFKFSYVLMRPSHSGYLSWTAHLLL